MTTEHKETTLARAASTILHLSEDLLYLVVSVLLVAGAGMVLIDTAYGLVTDLDDGTTAAVEHALDSLLIVFILIELLGAVRETVRRRHLVAEPFLLVGMIASIKEIVVLSAFAPDDADVGDTVLQIGVLGAVVVGLSVALLLLRQKEQHPAE
jgi:uncharacterized membrane protein (DUF373 family)